MEKKKFKKIYIEISNICNLNNLNKMYNTNYGNEGRDEIDIFITYGSRIQSIKIDYTINNDIKVYNLEFINIGKTDFSDIREYYKEGLN